MKIRLILKNYFIKNKNSIILFLCENMLYVSVSSEGSIEK